MLRKYQKYKRQAYFYISHISSGVIYRYSELNNGSKISIFGIILCTLSLFLPWIESLDGITPLPSGNMQENAFSVFVGYIGYLLILLLMGMCFTLISKRRKERLKYFSLLDIPERIMVLYSASLILIISLQYLFIVGSLQTMSQNIIYGKGLILSTVSAVILLFGYVLLKQARKKQHTASYGYDGGDVVFEKRSHDINNMKLPF